MLIRTALAALAFASAAPAQAQLHASDIILTVENNAIVTNSVVGPDLEPNRVFGIDLQLSGGFWAVANPGFDCDPGTFPTGSDNVFRFVDAVREWDGNDFDSYADEQMSIEFGPAGPVFTPVSPGGEVLGFGIPIQSNGGWHRHYDYYLEAPADPGVYLLSLVIENTSTGDETETFYIIFNRSMAEAELLAAIDFMQNSLVGCPANLNTDDTINAADLSILLSAFNSTPETANWNEIADLNGDNEVGPSDLSILLSVFGDGCP